MSLRTYHNDNVTWIRFVPSRTRPNETHQVDLKANNGNGECSCEAFHYRHRKNLQSGMVCSRCPHIELASMDFNLIMADVMETALGLKPKDLPSDIEVDYPDHET